MILVCWSPRPFADCPFLNLQAHLKSWELNLGHINGGGQPEWWHPPCFMPLPPNLHSLETCGTLSVRTSWDLSFGFRADVDGEFLFSLWWVTLGLSVSAFLWVLCGPFLLKSPHSEKSLTYLQGAEVFNSQLGIGTACGWSGWRPSLLPPFLDPG